VFFKLKKNLVSTRRIIGLTIWFENGRFYALMLDHYRKFSDKEIYYTQSADGLKWEVNPNPVAVTKNISLTDDTINKHGVIERPFVLIEKGVATHAFFATKNEEIPIHGIRVFRK